MENKAKQLVRQYLKEAEGTSPQCIISAKGKKLIDLYYKAVNSLTDEFKELHEFSNANTEFIDKALAEFDRKNPDLVATIEALEDLGTFNKSSGKVRDKLAEYMYTNGYVGYSKQKS